MTRMFDLRSAINSLGKVKAYVVTVVLTLGLTLGALVAIFNLNYQLLVKPLPYADQDKLTMLQGDSFLNGQQDLANMYPFPVAIEAYKLKDSNFTQKALAYAATDIIRSMPDTPKVNVNYITPEYLQMLQEPMALGRIFNADEGLDSNSPVAIISAQMWQQFYNLDPSVLGKTIQFGTVTFKIIGVTADTFAEPQLFGAGRLTQVWLPLDYSPIYAFGRTAWGAFFPDLRFVARLKEGAQAATIEQEFTAHMNARFKEETDADPISHGRSIKFHLLTYQDAIVGSNKNRLLLLLAGTFTVAMIAAANIINLMLARVSSQQRSMAIKVALGARKFHLFKAVLMELLLLLMLSVVLSFFVAFGGIELLKKIAGNQLPRLAELSLNWQSLLFALLSALVMTLLFAALTGRQVKYNSFNNLLQSSSKGGGMQISVKVRHLLITMQAALLGILLAASLQVLQQSWRNIIQPLGFAIKNVYQVQLNTGTQTELSYQEQKSNLITIRNKLLVYPKVADASLMNDFPIRINTLPFSDYLSSTADFTKSTQAFYSLVDEHYLNILALKLVSGRYFTEYDFQNDSTMLIVNETLARQLDVNGQVLAKRFYWLNSSKPGMSYEIVGVVNDLSLPGQIEVPRMYAPEVSVQYPQLLLKLKPNQQFTKLELNELMAKVNSQYKVADLLSIESARRLILANDILSAWITFTLAILALTLGTIGIYGVLSYGVQLRRFELGIRMAIGARTNIIILQILKDNLTAIFVGLLIAFVVNASIWIWMQRSAFSLETTSLSWILPPLLILLLTAVASLLSVRRIVSSPVSTVLRND